MIEATYYDLKQKAGLSPSLATHVAGELGRKIVSQSYEPGSLIEDEAALAHRYNVSRSVVRDAVKILVGKNLLEVRRGIGTRVNPREMWGLLDDDVLAWSQAAPPDPVKLRKLLEVRQTFEPTAAKWAAERGTTENHAEIVRAMEGMANNQNSLEDFLISDAQFHRAILRSTGNEFLVALEGLVFTGLLSILKLTNLNAQDNAASVPLHRTVCNAILARNGDSAKSSMKILLGDADSRLADRLASMSQVGNNEIEPGVTGNGRVGSNS